MDGTQDDALALELCPHCGGPAQLDVLEVYPEERAITFDTCCEGAYTEALMDMELWDRKDWQRFLADQAGLDVRTVVTDAPVTGQWTLDWGLTVQDVDWATARDFVGRYHRHNVPPRGWKWGHGIYNGPDLVAVVCVGRPVARGYNGRPVVEVNRLCVRDDLEAGLVWNACSMGYAAAFAEAERRGLHHLLTYTLETELAASVKAAGFVLANPDLTPAADPRKARTKGGSWNTPARARVDTAETCRKVRWVRTTKAGKRAAKAAARAA